ncbi:unnamed protein product [Ectocarpus sp. 6 AP-2014]
MFPVAAFVHPYAARTMDGLASPHGSSISGYRAQRLVAYSNSPPCSKGSVTARHRSVRRTTRTTTMGFKSPVDVLKQGIAKIGAGPYDKDAVVKVVDGYTSGSNKVVVFSWTRCPFCKKAKGLIEDLLADPADYEFVELDERQDGNAIRYELSQKTGRTSVPQIWIGGEFVGGCNDGPGVFTLMDKGELVPMLESAGCALKK